MTKAALRDTRAVILDSAESVVARDGVANLTFEAVAAEARISKGGVLHHFRSKEDLATAMIERSIAWFDDAVRKAARSEKSRSGTFTRAYVRASVGDTPDTGDRFDRICASITTALLNFPDRLARVREQGARNQHAFEADGLDPVLATIIRLAIDGLWLSENFKMMEFDPAMKSAVIERLIAWTRAPTRRDKLATS